MWVFPAETHPSPANLRRAHRGFWSCAINRSQVGNCSRRLPHFPKNTCVDVKSTTARSNDTEKGGVGVVGNMSRALGLSKKELEKCYLKGWSLVTLFKKGELRSNMDVTNIGRGKVHHLGTVRIHSGCFWCAEANTCDDLPKQV